VCCFQFAPFAFVLAIHLVLYIVTQGIPSYLKSSKLAPPVYLFSFSEIPIVYTSSMLPIPSVSFLYLVLFTTFPLPSFAQVSFVFVSRIGPCLFSFEGATALFTIL
jgi:hypothetical protein